MCEYTHICNSVVSIVLFMFIIIIISLLRSANDCVNIGSLICVVFHARFHYCTLSLSRSLSVLSIRSQQLSKRHKTIGKTSLAWPHHRSADGPSLSNHNHVLARSHNDHVWILIPNWLVAAATTQWMRLWTNHESVLLVCKTTHRLQGGSLRWLGGRTLFDVRVLCIALHVMVMSIHMFDCCIL